ncbi:MAG: outer membrane protein assembly factor BamB family protein [Planctomycetota bacterium]|jgi:outer membrane protein assembly factor BamB
MKRLSLIALTCGLAAAAASGGDAVGWRMDGVGRYPDADPVTEWGEGNNVVWAAPMPAASNAIPILVGEKIFVTADPATLICVNKADGEILWKRSDDYKDFMTPEQLEKIAAASALRDRYTKAKNELGKLKRQLKKKPDDAALKEKIAAQAKVVRARKAEHDPVARYARPATHKSNGHSSATPTSDGKCVYAVYGIGVAVCYDMEGNLKWRREIDKPTDRYGHSASPLLVGDKLIVHVLNMVALDAGTGEEVWRARVRHGWGSTVLAKIGGKDVAITPGGDAVDVADGTVLARKLGKLTYATPVMDGDVAYFVQSRGVARKLSLTGDGKIVGEKLWTVKKYSYGRREARFYASAALGDGLVFALPQKGPLVVIDAADGKVVSETKISVKGDCYSSVTQAGKYLFLASEKGDVYVFEIGREPKQVASFKAEGFRSTPVFDGKRMYLRGYKNLYCIGQSGATSGGG